MAMSDCEKCWNTPCVCGWELRDRSIEYLEKQKKMIEIVIEFKKRYPGARFPEYNDIFTEYLQLMKDVDIYARNIKNND